MIGQISIEGSGTETVTFGRTFRPGEAYSGIGIFTLGGSSLNTHCDVRARHPDGSVRHAVLTGMVTGGQSYTLEPVNLNGSAPLTLSALLSTVLGDIATIVLSAGLTGTIRLRELLDGTVSPAAPGIRILGATAGCLDLAVSVNVATHVRITFALRWYGGTLMRLMPLFENGYGNLNSQGAFQYTAVVTLMGNTVAGPIVFDSTRPHFNHAMATPNNRGYWTSGGTLHVRSPAGDLLVGFPNYGLTNVPTDPHLNTLRQDCPLMDNGDYRDNLDDSGSDQTIAINPRFDVTCIKSGLDRRAYECVLANARGGMAYSFHIMDSTTGEHMTADRFPNASYNIPQGYGTGLKTGLNIYGDSSVNSHVPSVGYLAYILTGDYAYLRVMQGWVTFTEMWTSPNTNVIFNGKTVRPNNEGSIRGIAWNIRGHLQAAYIFPDAHPMKAHFVNAQAGMADHYTRKYGPGGTQREALGVWYCSEGANNYSQFYHHFISSVTAHGALDLGFGEWLAVAQYSGILIAGLTGSTGEFPFEAAPSDRKMMGTTGSGVPPDSDVYFQTFAEVRAANILNSADSGTAAFQTYLNSVGEGLGTRAINTVKRSDDPFGFYAQVRASTSYLEALGIDGGAESWYRLSLSPVQPDFSNAGEMDIVPQRYRIPMWVQNLAIGQVYSIPNTKLSSVAPNPTPLGSTGPRSKTDAWCGAWIRTRDSMYGHGPSGGHADYAGNELDGIRLEIDTPAWVNIKPPTPNAQITANTRRYLDGNPAARHCYYNGQFIQGLNRMMQVGSASIWDPNAGGRSYNNVDVFDFASGAWMPTTTIADATGSAGEKPIATSPSTELIYYVALSGALYRLNGKTGNTLKIGDTNSQNIDRAMCVDPIRHRALIAPDAFGIGWQFINLATGAITNVTIDVGGNNSQGALCWDRIGNRYLYLKRSAGNTLYSINPGTGVATPVPLTGSIPTIPAATPGVFSKMQFVPRLGGVVINTGHDVNLTFIKLYSIPSNDAAPVVTPPPPDPTVRGTIDGTLPGLAGAAQGAQVLPLFNGVLDALLPGITGQLAGAQGPVPVENTVKTYNVKITATATIEITSNGVQICNVQVQQG